MKVRHCNKGELILGQGIYNNMFFVALTGLISVKLKVWDKHGKYLITESLINYLLIKKY